MARKEQADGSIFSGLGGDTSVKERPSEVMGKFTIEVGGENNRGTRFRYMQENYRGKFLRTGLAGKDTGHWAMMPDYPGIHITLDIGDRTMRVHDPLNKNEKLKAEIEAVCKKAKGEKPRFAFEDRVRERLDNDNIKTILVEMRQIFDSKLATVHGQDLPNDEQIATMPGRKLINQRNSDPSAPKREGEMDMRDTGQILGFFLNKMVEMQERNHQEIQDILKAR